METKTTKIQYKEQTKQILRNYTVHPDKNQVHKSTQVVQYQYLHQKHVMTTNPNKQQQHRNNRQKQSQWSIQTRL